MSNALKKITFLSLAALPALMLSACGGGSGGDSHTEPYHGVPYTEERTAGSGVAYVRGKMLPPKETNTKMIEEKAPEPAPAPAPKAEEPPPVEAPVTQGDKMFDHKQAK